MSHKKQFCILLGSLLLLLLFVTCLSTNMDRIRETEGEKHISIFIPPVYTFVILIDNCRKNFFDSLVCAYTNTFATFENRISHRAWNRFTLVKSICFYAVKNTFFTFIKSNYAVQSLFRVEKLNLQFQLTFFSHNIFLPFFVSIDHFGKLETQLPFFFIWNSQLEEIVATIITF